MSRACARLLTSLALITGAGAARAQGQLSDEQDDCVKSYESAQEHRLNGALHAAVPELERCAQSVCPAFIRTDCAKWSTEVAAELPSLQFSVTSAGRTLQAVRLYMDDALLAERLPNLPIELDPGLHRFVFEAEGYETFRQSVLVERAQKARPIAVELRPVPLAAAVSHADAAPAIVPPTAAAAPALVPPTAAEAEPLRSSSNTGALALGAVGVGGVTGFLLLGLHARSTEHELRDACAPHCSSAEVSSVRSQYLMADISLGVGLTSLAFSTYLFLSEPPAKHAAKLSLPVALTVGRGSAGASFAGAF